MRNSKDKNSLTLYAIQQQKEEARNHDTPQTAADPTAARGKLHKAKRRALNEIDEIDPKVLCFPLEVLRGAD